MSTIEEALRRLRDSPDAPASGPAARRPGSGSGGDIARMKNPPAWPLSETEARGIVDFTSARQRAGHAFRQLRTTLLQRTGGGNFILGITGVAQQAGTSFLARNLAAAFALDPTKTALLIDCSLVDRTTTSLAMSPDGPGLVDYLCDDTITIESIIRPSGIPRLRVIPAGSAGEVTGELYTGPRLRALFEQLKRRYTDRYVLLDLPPVVENADARILAERCDWTLLVIPYGRVAEPRIEQAMDSLDQARLVGVVLNNDPPVIP